MDSIHDQKSGSPESLVTRAFAGFRRVSKPDWKAALTTGMTTDRKIFDFRPQRGIISKTEYPGVAELVPRHIWDVEIARSNRVTRTIKKRLFSCENAVFCNFSRSFTVYLEFLTTYFCFAISRYFWNYLCVIYTFGSGYLRFIELFGDFWLTLI